MNKYILITNNPLVLDKYKNQNIVIEKCEKINEIFRKTRDLIHKGYILVSHPLAGSVKPFKNPYRSIILKENAQLDMSSLKAYENSFEKYQQFKANKKEVDELPQEILEDYQVIDLSLIESALQSIDLSD